MTEQQLIPQNRFTHFWDKLVRVSVPLDDEEQERIGALFNTLSLVATMMTLTLSIPLVVAWRRGYFPDPTIGLLTALSPFFLLPITIICFFLVKKGYLRYTIPFYVWFNLVMIIVTGVIFGGSSSVGWFMLLWPITLAGSLLKPADTLRFTAIAVVVYSIVAWAQGTNRFTPPLEMPQDTTKFLTIAFYWIILIIVGGIVYYLNVSSLSRYLGTARSAKKLAENIQSELEDRVEERTGTLVHRAEQFKAIAELGKVTSIVRDESKLLDTTVNLISQQMGFYHVAIFLIEPGGQWAILKSASSEGGANMIARGHRLRVGQQGVVGYVSRTGLPRFALDVGEDAVWFENPDLPETKSEIALPLLSVSGVFGVLDIQTQKRAAFDEQDVEVLKVLADNVAIAIENTRLLTEARITLERLERYQEQDAIRAWRQALARRQMKVGYRYQSGLVETAENFYEPQQIHADNETVTVSSPEPGLYQMTARIAVGGNVAGSLVFERSTPWNNETIQLVESVVTQLDLALNNARLIEETRLRASQETVKNEIVERIRALTSTDGIMRRAAEELGRVLRVERSRIQLVQLDEKA